MTWTALTFGKHKGITLPQVLFRDPDWFFWAIENGVFDGNRFISNEAKLLNRRARNIIIKPHDGIVMVAEYVLHPPTAKFSHVDIVPVNQPKHEGSSPTFRSDTIDLSVPRKIAPFDKLGGKNMINSIKLELFGSSKCRLTKNRCESFFDNEDNFK